MATQTRILVAGATGYLGGYLIDELRRRGYHVRALARSAAKAAGIRNRVDDVFIGEVTDPVSLHGISDGIDIVISSIGITRQKDGLTYMDVDYRGNANLLRESIRSGVGKFVYVSVLHADEMKDLKIVEAKERFVAELKRSEIDCTIVRPNGYFSDMHEFLRMAERGRVFLFGSGAYRINPLHGADVAQRCVEAMENDEAEVAFGGPDILTHRQIAELAFEAAAKRPRITTIPVALARVLLVLLRLLTPVKFYGPLEFTLTVLTRDMIGIPYGHHHLLEFFRHSIVDKQY